MFKTNIFLVKQKAIKILGGMSIVFVGLIGSLVYVDSKSNALQKQIIEPIENKLEKKLQDMEENHEKKQDSQIPIPNKIDITEKIDIVTPSPIPLSPTQSIIMNNDREETEDSNKVVISEQEKNDKPQKNDTKDSTEENIEVQKNKSIDEPELIQQTVDIVEKVPKKVDDMTDKLIDTKLCKGKSILCN